MRNANIHLLSAIGESFIPPRHPGDWHGGDKASVAIMAEYGRRGPWFMQIAFIGAAWILNLSPVFLVGKLTLFTRLSPADRHTHLRRFAKLMPFALIFAPLRAFLGITIYSRPDAIAETGYHNAGKRKAAV